MYSSFLFYHFFSSISLFLSPTFLPHFTTPSLPPLLFNPHGMLRHLCGDMLFLSPSSNLYIFLPPSSPIPLLPSFPLPLEAQHVEATSLLGSIRYSFMEVWLLSSYSHRLLSSSFILLHFFKLFIYLFIIFSFIILIYLLTVSEQVWVHHHGHKSRGHWEGQGSGGDGFCGLSGILSLPLSPPRHHSLPSVLLSLLVFLSLSSLI